MTTPLENLRNIPEPAFPTKLSEDIWHIGMSRRQWLAGLAMEGMCANPDLTTDKVRQEDHNAEFFARVAYAIADAMLAYEEKIMAKGVPIDLP